MNETGDAWAGRFLAPRTAPWGETRNGQAMTPAQGGGYGAVPYQQYQGIPQPAVKPAGVGPIEAGTEGINLPWWMQKPRLTGRNAWGDPWRQGERFEVFSVGPQGFDASAKTYR